MPDRGVIRIFRFAPAVPEFDQILRTVLIPDMLRLDGVLAVHAGRRHASGLEHRILSSIWASRARMVASIGNSFDDPPFHPELLDATDKRDLLLVDLEFSHEFGLQPGPAILRLVRGLVRAGELDAYVAEAEAGTLSDAAAGQGPLALYLGRDGPDGFVTLSLWPDWATLQAATGGDVNRPIATRHAARLSDWAAWHYEVITAQP